MTIAISNVGTLPGQKSLKFVQWLMLVTLVSVHVNLVWGQCFSCQDAPAGTIFCDDFEVDNLNKNYFEINTNAGDFIRKAGVGRDGSYGMRVLWQKGEVSAGVLSKSFGRTPDTYIGKNASSPGLDFDEIYWRMDVKSQPGWTGGGPAKLSRALVLANSNWAEGMMAHLWSAGQNNAFLALDPASGIGLDGVLKSTKYNDFANLRWLGLKVGTLDMFSTENSGRWFCVVGHVKLNTPGLSDGIFEFWINDTLQASSKNLNWHSTWNADPKNMHINAIFFENYWNDGSPVEQERYFDNLVISTKPIACQSLATNMDESSVDNNIFNLSIVDHQIDIRCDRCPVGGVLELVDLNGKIVLKKALEASEATVDASFLPNGFYIVSLNGFNLRKLIFID
ncbi:MAG: hypothetical protein U0V49_13865 [Saprospiraceae bacterium]